MDRQMHFLLFVLVGLLGGAGPLVLAATVPNQFASGTLAGNEVEVVLELTGDTVQGKLALAPADNTFPALFAVDQRTLDVIDVQGTGNNAWKCRLRPGTRYVIGWISDKMFGYQSQPFLAQEGLRVPFSPGLPGAFEYDLRHPPAEIKVIPADVRLMRDFVKDGKGTFISWMEGAKKVTEPGLVRIDGLAAGPYHLSATQSDKQHTSFMPFLYDNNRMVEIKPGVVNRFEPNYPEVDRTVEKGDVTIRGTIYRSNKKPARGQTIHLVPSGGDRVDFRLYYPAAKTDRQGRFEFVGVRPNIMATLWSQDGKSAVTVMPAWMREDASISIDLFLGLKKLAVQTGKRMEDFAIDWRDGHEERFSDLAGKTVVIDVWATWCGPCKRAMPALDSLARELAPRGDVVFVALSVDYIRPLWEEMVDQSDWKSLRHGWLNRKRNTSYFETPIPYYVIVDKGGIVRAEGSFDIKQELDRVLSVPRP